MNQHILELGRIAIFGLFGLFGFGLVACGGGSDGGGVVSDGTTTSPGGGGTGGGGATLAAPAVTVSSPTANASLASASPVTVTFATQNFSVGGVNQPRLDFYLDDDPIRYTFINGTTNTVFYGGVPAQGAQWVTPTSFRLDNLSDGLHTVRLALVDAAGRELTNGEAGTARAFTVGVPFPTAPSVIVAGPAPNADVPGPVRVSFVVANHQIGPNGQPHMHFYIDGSAERHEYFDGAGITEENGVQLNGAHTHAVHWKSSTSIMLFGWAAGPHQIRFILADAGHGELANPEATQTVSFNITGTSDTSEFLLEPVLTGASAAGMAFAPDGKVFYADGHNGAGQGAVWIIDTVGGTWTRRPTPFYQTAVGSIGEQGLTGVAIDPNYAANGFVYAYFTAPGGGTNRLVRVRNVNDQAVEETVILDNLLAADQHNGGVLLFGPDGKLYVTVGEATLENLSQDLSSQNGKILRINSDGTIPADNPFQGSAVWSYGWRNSFGLAFHPATGDLWATDNGPTVDDEVNLVVKGGNYGWPLVTGNGGAPPLINPVYVLAQPVGITNIVALAETPVYPTKYHNNLFFTDFVGGKIRRLVLDPTFKSLVSDSIVFDGGVGGLVPLKQGPDGYLYTSGPGAFYRVVPNPGSMH